MGLQDKGLRSLIKGALRLVYPPQCLCCGESTAEEGALCGICWRETHFISGTCCNDCGAPLPDNGDPAGRALALRCDDCRSSRRPWQAARAAFIYLGAGRRLVLAFKHGDRVDLAPALGDWLAKAAAPLIVPDMIVVPIPVHPRRLIRRKYNQSALLAKRVARVHGLTYRPDLLRRIRHTPSQDHKSVSDRFANLRDALAVPQQLGPVLTGRPVLLVDDVMTSGATLACAAAEISAAGAGPVCVAVLARVTKDT